MGGLSVNLEPYCEKLTQNIATDKVETPLCQEVLLATANKNYKIRDNIAAFTHTYDWDGFVLNQKLKGILDEYKINQHTRYSALIAYKNQQYDYTLLNFDKNRLIDNYRAEGIDYVASTFVTQNKERVIVNSWQEIIDHPEGLYIIELCVKKEFLNFDFQHDYLSRHHSDSVYYLISERLKLRLEEEKITGLSFSEPLNTSFIKIV
jgi:hypothetical protein